MVEGWVLTCQADRLRLPHEDWARLRSLPLVNEQANRSPTPGGLGKTIVKLDHPPLVDLLRRAYSAEMAAAFAYVGHASSLKDPASKAAVRQIETDEWHHRKQVLALMRKYDVPVSRYYEARFYLIGKAISLSCHLIGWFMPYYFAGKLESGNVCEYFRMMHYFQSLGITEHDAVLYEMGIKEKEHEVFFLEQIKTSRLLPLFERLFGWGVQSSRNDVDLEHKYSVREAHQYCLNYKVPPRTHRDQPDPLRTHFKPK